MAENENKQENVVVEDFKRTNAEEVQEEVQTQTAEPGTLHFYEDNKQYLLLLE